MTEPKLERPRASLPVARSKPILSPRTSKQTEPLENAKGAPEIRAPLPVDLLIRYQASSRLIPLQSWEGFVESIDWEAGTFWARLADLEPGGSVDEEGAEFFISDVTPDDKELIREGAVFRWIIGYRDQVYGKRERISSLVFRRLPAWRAKDLEEAHKEGSELAAAFQWD